MDQMTNKFLHLLCKSTSGACISILCMEMITKSNCQHQLLPHDLLLSAIGFDSTFAGFILGRCSIFFLCGWCLDVCLHSMQGYGKQLVHMHTHAHRQRHMHTHVHKHVHVQRHVHTHTHAHRHTHMCTHMCTHMYNDMCECMYVCF